MQKRNFVDSLKKIEKFKKRGTVKIGSEKRHFEAFSDTNSSIDTINWKERKIRIKFTQNLF